MNTLSIRVMLAFSVAATVSGCVVEGYPNKPIHGGYYEHRDYNNHDNNHNNNSYKHCPPGQHKKHRC